MDEWCYGEEDWTEKLIRAVQSKPALYDSSTRDYCNRGLNKKLWGEVCATIHENWNNLSPKDKAIKGNEVQNRWRNLRTCFKRELNRQKNAPSTHGAKKRRRYVYFNKLLFLLPTIEDKESTTTDNTNQIKEEVYEEEKEQEHIDVVDDDYMEHQQLHSEPHYSESPNDNTFKRKDFAKYHNSLPNILASLNETEMDEDVLFLLSLVPSFQKFTEDQKFDAKMEFLKVIKRKLAQRSNSNGRATFANHHGSTSGSKSNRLMRDCSSNCFEQILPDAGKSSATYEPRDASEYSSDET